MEVFRAVCRAAPRTKKRRGGRERGKNPLGKKPTRERGAARCRLKTPPEGAERSLSCFACVRDGCGGGRTRGLCVHGRLACARAGCFVGGGAQRGGPKFERGGGVLWVCGAKGGSRESKAGWQKRESGRESPPASQPCLGAALRASAPGARVLCARARGARSAPQGTKKRRREEGAGGGGERGPPPRERRKGKRNEDEGAPPSLSPSLSRLSGPA